MFLINSARPDTVYCVFSCGRKEEPPLGQAKGQGWNSSPCPFSLQLAAGFMAEKCAGMFTSWFSEGQKVLLRLGRHFWHSLFGGYTASPEWQQVFAFPPRERERESGRRRRRRKRRVNYYPKRSRPNQPELRRTRRHHSREKRDHRSTPPDGESPGFNKDPTSGRILKRSVYVRRLKQTAVPDPRLHSGTMGVNDDDCGSRIVTEDPKSDVHADRKTGSFNQHELCISPETGNSPDDISHRLESAFLSDRAVDAGDDGLERSHQGQSLEDDEEGHLVYHVGLVLKHRYEVVSTLGAGAFGKVVECIDRQKDEHVAVKIVRNIECFRDVARSEIAVLEEINSLDDDNRFACVRMLDWFEHEGHICIVFELLGISTFEFLRQNKFLPFSVEQIRHMAFQIFRAVCFLHRNKLTHTDLKPENILFVCSDVDLQFNNETRREERKLRSLDVKVVDFGTATFDHQHHESLVSTRHYRAPEVILDLGWNQSCDVWSLGCVLMEFYLGCTLFVTHDSKEHLAMMEKVLGPIPPHLLKQTRKHHYVHNERLNWDERSSSDDYIRTHCKPLKQYMQRTTEEEKQLFDLLGLMLEYDVCRRITLEEALWHPFFSPLRAQTQRRS